MTVQGRSRLWRRVALAVMIVALTSGACAARGGAVPRPFPGPTPPIAASSIAPEVVATALALRGTAYRNGGSEPSRGFDCSGLVQWVFAKHGAALPRETREQYAAGSPVGKDEVQPGDLVFFETVSKGPSHVGIALGGSEFVHAPSSRGVVRVENYTTSDYWSRRWVGAKRIVPPAGS